MTYHEIQSVGNGVGNYTSYTDQTVTDGIERMNQVYSNDTVASYYDYNWTWNDNSGNSKTGSSSGPFSWSSTSLLYVKGTDGQVGYTNPTVWFFMDNTLQQGDYFRLLNTQMTVSSTSYSYHLTSENKNVNAISAQGTGNYLRSDSYGRFNATYTWTTYFDPNTGYIIGYDLSEQDSSSAGNGFSYTDSLYVTATSYPLTAAPGGLSQYLGIIVAAVLIVLAVVIIAVIAYAVSRRRSRLPKHPPQEAYRPPVPTGPPPQIDLPGIREQPEQIVIKEVVKVKCRYCGALIDSTVQACPFCGAPRT